VLRRVPGVFASNRHNPGEGVRLAVRAPYPAFGTRGLQVVQDGVPLTMADGTTPEPNNLTLGSAGRIEVIRGPSSVLYGNSAGGVVSVETEFPSERPFFFMPELQFGSHGYQRQQLKASGTGAGVGYLVSLSRMQSDGFRGRSEADVRQANVVLQAPVAASTVVRGVLNLYDMPFGGNSSTLNLATARDNPASVRPVAVNNGMGKSVTQGQGGIVVEQGLADGHQLRFLGWGVRRNNLIAVPNRVVDLGRTGGGIRSEYRGGAGPDWLSLGWTTGFDVSQQADDRREYRNRAVAGLSLPERMGDQIMDQREEVRSLGPFAQLSFTPLPAWSLTTGVRYDRYDFKADDRFPSGFDDSGERTMSAVSPMAGITYTPAGWLNLYGSLGTSYKTPTTVELSNRPDGRRGFNEELDPEYWRSYELGVRGRLDALRLRYELVGYLSTVDNALVKYEDVDEKSIYRNAGESSRDGIEALLEWYPLPFLEARVAYTYQDFRFVNFATDAVDYSGNVEPGAPPHSVFAGLTYDAPYGVRAGVDFRWVDAYYVDDANTASNWAYRLVDLRLGLDRSWRSTTLRPFVGVDNVFDERYNASTMLNAFGGNYFEPAPGRTFYTGLSMGLR
jgi:iron complex outermembrane recepter protein